MAPLILLFLTLVFSDMVYTHFMLGRYGLGIELNPTIPWLARKFGLAFGVFAGIAIPSLLFLFLGIYFRPLLEFITLCRLMLFFLQAQQLRIQLCLFQRKTAHN
jgi:hypothetical protein